MLPDHFIDNIPEEPFAALEYIFTGFRDLFTDATREQEDNEFDLNFYDRFVEMVALSQTILDLHGLDSDVALPDFQDHASNNMRAVEVYFRNLREDVKSKMTKSIFEDAQSRFSSLFSHGFYYEFSQSELERVQELINELRQMLSESCAIDGPPWPSINYLYTT